MDLTYKTLDVFRSDTHMYEVINRMILDGLSEKEGYLAYEDTKKVYAKYIVKVNCQYQDTLEFVVRIINVLTGASDNYNVIRNKKEVFENAFDSATRAIC